MNANATPQPKTAIVHFGCRLNQFESDGIKANLAENSHRIVADQREADFIVINTCTVTNKADYKNRAAIRRAHRLNPQAKIVVTGCYATTDAEDLRSLPGVYRVISNDKKHAIAETLRGNDAPAETNDRFFFSSNHDFKSRATLKIQDGCNKSCSYCKIPQARGRGVSRSFEATIASAQELIAAGFGELVLTGVNIGWYEDHGTGSPGSAARTDAGIAADGGRNFYSLVEKILDLPGNFHLRVSSIEPGDVNERFAEFYRHEKMAKFLHIPLQSGSKFVLRTMRRGYTPDNFRRRIDAVRRVNADVHIGTDIIVGFPSEGDAEFQETLDFCRAADFANIHIFPFSKRRNTPIVEWLEKREGSAAKRIYREINGQVIRERAAALAQLKAEMAAAYARRMAGKEFWATVEKTTEGVAQFTTENYLRGSIADTQLRRGERFRVTL